MRRSKSFKSEKNKIDKGLLFLTVFLVLLGLVAIADVSAPQAQSVFSDSFYYAKQQLLWAILGVCIMLVISKINYNFWKKVSLPLFILSTLLLLIILIPGVAPQLLGAKRWLILGPVTFQPSELVKLSLILYFARLADSEKSLLSFLLPMGLIGFLIMLQPDLGTTLIVVSISFVALFLTGFSLIHLTGVLATGFLTFLSLILISDYRRARLMTFFEQSVDPLGKSYHIRQILLALGSGGFLGVGLGNSRQKYLFLPEAATDSIFAVIAEEIGFIGASLLIILFAVYVFRIIKIARTRPDKFSMLTAVGIATWVGSQAFLNLGSMVALVPLTGVPLPFFSYGGSSLTMLLIAIGILLNISRASKV